MLMWPGLGRARNGACRASLLARLGEGKRWATVSGCLEAFAVGRGWESGSTSWSDGLRDLAAGSVESQPGGIKIDEAQGTKRRSWADLEELPEEAILHLSTDEESKRQIASLKEMGYSTRLLYRV